MPTDRKRGSFIAIESDPPAARPRNPYRSLLRKRFPSLLLALLGLVWAVHLIDGYFGRIGPTEPATDPRVLRFVDRELRLAEGLAEFDVPLHWLVYQTDLPTTQRDMLAVLDTAAGDGLLDASGLIPEAVLRLSVGDYSGAFEALKRAPDLPPARLALTLTTGQHAPEPEDLDWLTGRLLQPDAWWWEAELGRQLADRGIRSTDFRTLESFVSQRNEALLYRAVTSSGAVWFLILAGLPFVPAAWRLLTSAATVERTGYVRTWPLSLIVGLYLLTDLAALGFFGGAYRLLSEMTNAWPPMVDLVIDSLWRLLPALLMLCWFFRRPSHAGRVFRLDAPIPWKAVFGLFSLLTLVNFALAYAIEPLLSVDPTGGLPEASPGWFGLVRLVLSACVLAPVVEEIIYRGFVFNGLASRVGVHAGALMASAIFALAHFYGLHGLLSVGIFGYVCCLLYHRTGSLAGPIVLHAVYNLTLTVPTWLIYQAPFR